MGTSSPARPSNRFHRRAPHKPPGARSARPRSLPPKGESLGQVALTMFAFGIGAAPFDGARIYRAPAWLTELATRARAPELGQWATLNKAAPIAISRDIG